MKCRSQLVAFAFALTTLTLSAPISSAQHDGARNAVRLIVKGKFTEAEKALRERQPDAGPSEAAFVRMLALLAEEKVGEALAMAQEAVRLGLPIGRLAAGPREALGPLHRFPAYQEWLAEQRTSDLVHGPMIGDVTAHSASIWVRTDGPAEVQVKTLGGPESAKVRTSSERDFTAVLTLAGLEPNKRHRFQAFVDDQALANGSFRTFPEVGSSGQFSVAFGGGAGFVPEWEFVWDNIRRLKPHAFLMLGDNVYIDDPKSPLTQRYCYYRRQSRPEWRRMTSSTPIYSIWDDHDFGTDDCVPGANPEVPAWKKDVRQVFQENWVNPGYGTGGSPGCWYDFHIGDVHFIMLDGRYYRDPEAGSMLGAAQKSWLLKTLQQSTATFKVVASPVPFTEGIKPGSRDPWDGYPAEREEIFRHIEENDVEGVLLISGDRHRTDLRVTKRPDGYDLYEFESSRLTNHHTHPVVETPGLLYGYSETCSFGFMRFNTAAPDPTVTFDCLAIDGTVKFTHRLLRSELARK